jgi:molecular chaperone Hsp33
MLERDTLRPFLFEHAAVRGELVHLDASWREMLQNHDYPEPLRQLLGQMVAATALLTATLKFDGVLSLQLQGSGPVTLGVMECSHNGHLRGLIHWEGDVQPGTLDELLGNGRMVVTLEQRKTGERYQGVVDIKGQYLAQALEHYLFHSEQLETRLWLAADGQGAAGLLLQRLPAEDELEDADTWQRLSMVADTIKDEELLGLEAEEIIHRLFHEDDVRLFEGRPLAFRCHCSRERVANALRMLGQAEVNDILQQEGSIEVACEFCNRKYSFDAVDAEALFATAAVVDGPKTQQ